MNKHELKRQLDLRGSRFFSRENMKFVGDTMRNYHVSAKPVDVPNKDGDMVACWELRRIHPVKHGFKGSAYFRLDNLEQEWPA
jgi:hypothetical protein